MPTAIVYKALHKVSQLSFTRTHQMR